jgi:hypothetical protein
MLTIPAMVTLRSLVIDGCSDAFLCGAAACLLSMCGAMSRGSRKSYAPPVSGAELSSARVGAMLGRPVNTTGWAFFAFFLFFYFFVFSGFSFPFLFSFFLQF